MSTDAETPRTEPLPLRKAMERPFNLGQTYWQQADHEFISQQRKADATQQKFCDMADATCAQYERDIAAARARVAELEAGLRASLESVQNTLEAAYHNCFESCCGRAGYECCGNTVQTWTPEDQRTMDVLGPVERSLRALLSPSPEPRT